MKRRDETREGIRDAVPRAAPSVAHTMAVENGAMKNRNIYNSNNHRINNDNTDNENKENMDKNTFENTATRIERKKARDDINDITNQMKDIEKLNREKSPSKQINAENLITEKIRGGEQISGGKPSGEKSSGELGKRPGAKSASKQLLKALSLYEWLEEKGLGVGDKLSFLYSPALFFDVGLLLCR